jgi:hypothetical protein
VNSAETEEEHVLKTVRNCVASVSQTDHPATEVTHLQNNLALFSNRFQMLSIKLPLSKVLCTVETYSFQNCSEI